MKHQQLSMVRRQIDRRLKPVASISDFVRSPSEGWVRTLRQALGMRLKDLASRMGVTESAVRDIEKSETKGKITLDRLNRAAAALDCDLFYALVPKSSLEETFERRIHRRARSDAKRTAATMDLERQGLGVEETERQLKELVQDYLRDPPKNLWHD